MISAKDIKGNTKGKRTHQYNNPSIINFRLLHSITLLEGFANQPLYPVKGKLSEQEKEQAELALFLLFPEVPYDIIRTTGFFCFFLETRDFPLLCICHDQHGFIL